MYHFIMTSPLTGLQYTIRFTESQNLRSSGHPLSPVPETLIRSTDQPWFWWYISILGVSQWGNHFNSLFVFVFSYGESFSSAPFYTRREGSETHLFPFFIDPVNIRIERGLLETLSLNMMSRCEVIDSGNPVIYKVSSTQTSKMFP